MKNLMMALAILYAPVMVSAQASPFELMAGSKNTLYQHTLVKPFEKDSRFGLLHIANVIVWYDENNGKKGRPTEIMNQGYLSMRLFGSLSLVGGGFYTNVTGFRASAGLLYVKKFKDFQFVLMPRVDAWKYGAVEMFAQVEYRPLIGRDLRLYSRAQAMSNYGPWSHNRSYQRLRLGLETERMQFGLALNLDEYGPNPAAIANPGLFIRKELF